MLRLENFLISVVEKQGALPEVGQPRGGVSRLSAKPKERRWVKSRKRGSYARASRPCPRLRGQAPTLPPRQSARRAFASKIHHATPAAAAVATAPGLSESGTSSSAASEKPRRVLGRGGASTAPARLLLSRPVKLTLAPTPRKSRR